jgi:hypothetical protein
MIVDNMDKITRRKRRHYAVKLFILLTLAEYIFGALASGSLDLRTWIWEFRMAWFVTWSAIDMAIIAVAIRKYR